MTGIVRSCRERLWAVAWVQLLFPNYENHQAASMLAADLRFIIIVKKQIQSWQQILSILRN